MCVVQLLVETINQINKYRRHCLCRGSDMHKKGNCLAAWSKVQRPKSQGGLGIIDLSAQNKALLPKHLHKFFNKFDVPWVDLTWKAFYSASLAPQARSPRSSFWWRALCCLFDQYRGYAKAVVGKGDTTLFGNISRILVHCSIYILNSFLLQENQIVRLVTSYVYYLIIQGCFICPSR
jgi:hypothetical protein